ncbi:MULTISPECIES: peptide-methionine (S)-S-oxide reductase MsrA [unclassified Lentimonas]|uniref:peptide-methionine (S)-S-oxide reductase MsrA n=2 Tax=unclassified Lentimonas TaxID=2630993 RepID=UPI00132AA825|nr:MULTISPECIES: peptide-methionine (S)-S-oxide reductase MsrA [unclassified Lentimonas]CAA6686765.1 Peptide methionine sulfoxide reductase MsrA (EC [Lentimonas sp. CC6]CAA6695540.1 Peptide methionine sulfoxide reductase MsrA (EC [Lentimonas sp. CC19]CAA7069872.1 Peptide methionine sulfoxide reductase MsrA (EC [Lentimonas sp. CC11]CAA7168184.1 Peptide methionine sulfoxide reductase MsrA (EC [Lentimonas sp. CC21]CAA7181664.1 Peptide methionine sulfoxide reductase MsrA (EC [Lentimonas sp. CC8]
MLQKTLPRLIQAGCLCFASALSLIACAEKAAPTTNDTTMTDSDPSSFEIATFGAGCFWCVEAVFENLDGVQDVESGYMGGEVKDPTYREVCTGTTGHAEITQITFDPAVISYETLLDWLWRSHNPTTLNQQGADKGTQYRSAIFYHSEAQREIAEASKAAAQKAFDRPIVTEITEASDYYPAEDYHQDYYRLNKAAPYCQMVIRPKLKKLDLE